MDSIKKRFERARRTLGDLKVSQAVRKDRAIIGGTIPEGEEKAQSAWDKLGNGEWPEPDEMAALEIVIRLLRPAPLSHGGVLDDLPSDPDHKIFSDELKDQWSSFRTKIGPQMYSIGRIDLAREGVHIGTGFLVADGKLATNRHVLDDLTFGSGVLAAGRAQVCFQREEGAPDEDQHIVPIKSALGYHPTLDMALLEVPTLSRPFVSLEALHAPEGQRVVVVGYPAKDSSRNPLFSSSIFGNKFGYKRGAFGEVLDGGATPNLFHDCSTMGGNSGSPVFSVTSGKAVGIHSGGLFRYRNEALDGLALTEYVGH